MTTMAAMVRFPWIKVAANLMGSGYFKSLSHQLFPTQSTDNDSPLQEFITQRAPLFSWDIGDNLSRITSRPLFVWHGEKDELVPCEESLRLEQALTASGEPHRVTFSREPQAGHKISIGALKQSVAFFKHHL
jgi:fermentation-respiration switch protein FrsA (DUF1100 family)